MFTVATKGFILSSPAFRNGVSWPLGPLPRSDCLMDNSQNLRTLSFLRGAGNSVLFISSEWHHGQCPAGGSSPGPTLLLPCPSKGRPVAQLTAVSPAWASCTTPGLSEDSREEGVSWLLCALVCVHVCACVHTWVCTHGCVHICACVCARVCMCTRVGVCMCEH